MELQTAQSRPLAGAFIVDSSTPYRFLGEARAIERCCAVTASVVVQGSRCHTEAALAAAVGRAQQASKLAAAAAGAVQ